MKLLFDATELSYYNENSGHRAGVFYVALNLLREFEKLGLDITFTCDYKRYYFLKEIQEFSKYKIKDNQDDGFYAKVCQKYKIQIIGLYNYYPGFFHDEIKPINGGSCKIPRWQKQQRFGKPA